MAAGTSEIVTPHFFLQAVAFLTAHRKKPQCIFSPRPFILVKGNLVILAIAAELVGGYDCSSRPLNATGVYSHETLHFRSFCFTSVLLLSTFPLVDVHDVIFQVSVPFVTDSLLLAALHMTVLF